MCNRRSILILTLALHIVHVPILVPDLDGECRGVPIGSLIERQAWHPILLGVRPNDDVDRGPIRTEGSDRGLDASPFGEFTDLSLRHALAVTPALTSCEVTSAPAAPSGLICARLTDMPRHAWGIRKPSIQYCRWQI